MEFKELIEKTKEVQKAFEKVEQRKWGIEGSMIELSKQVGELAQNVMMIENYYLAERKNNPKYNIASIDRIGNELSDMLFMIVRIADYYNIDLEEVHLKELDKALNEFKEE